MLPRCHRDHNRAHDARFDSERLLIHNTRGDTCKHDRVRVTMLDYRRHVESVAEYGPNEFVGGLIRLGIVLATVIVPYVEFLRYVRGMLTPPDQYQIHVLAVSNAMTPVQLRTYVAADVRRRVRRGCILAWIYVDTRVVTQYLVVDMTGHIPASAVALSGRHLQHASNMFVFMARVRGRGHKRGRICYLNVLNARMSSHVITNAAAVHDVVNAPLVIEFSYGGMCYDKWHDGTARRVDTLAAGSMSRNRMVWFPNTTERMYTQK